ncbi:hypothetical protein AGMMS50233_09390 [Endomicrobiia bacterium]|nr:hypothetical protein AGMMS50233_09390 [Endomicrobiia bacterium]
MKTKKVVIAIALFSLVLSSCKGCPHKEKDKNKTNPVVRVDEDDEDILTTGVGKYLKAKGADNAEIRQVLKIEKEDFGEDIGHIVYENNHYYYEGHDNGWTHCNCGLYAVKRLLFVLGKHDIVDKDLWYRYTDSQLREMLLEIPERERETNQNVTIRSGILITLMDDLGVPADHCKIYGRTGLILETSTVSDYIQGAINQHEDAIRDLINFDSEERSPTYSEELNALRRKRLEEDVKKGREAIEFWKRIEREHKEKIRRMLH